MTLWIVSDQKNGHLNQSIGLAEAMITENIDSSFEIVNYLTLPQLISLFLKKRLPNKLMAISKSDWVIGTGRKTHYTLLFFRIILKTKTIVLSKPSLPYSWFTLCVIPEHDSPPKKDNIVTSLGAINRVKPSEQLNSRKGLILIGGPSNHYEWSNSTIINQLEKLDHSVQWVLTTSRRTPPSFLEQLKNRKLNIKIIPFESTNNEWLLNKFKISGRIITSPDSVSMIYESLTSGSIVSIFSLKETKENRINRNIDQLLNRGIISKIDQDLPSPPPTIHESKRIARHIKNNI